MFPLRTFDLWWLGNTPGFLERSSSCQGWELSTVVQSNAYTGNNDIESHHGRKFWIRTSDHGVTISPSNFGPKVSGVTYLVRVNIHTFAIVRNQTANISLMLWQKTDTLWIALMLRSNDIMLRYIFTPYCPHMFTTKFAVMLCYANLFKFELAFTCSIHLWTRPNRVFLI